ncbi:MAG: Gfo/Idh/MocA family oxidoreductase [Anaerolineae bacterium]|nr:Gfo/Idh/MocA family oxidoreductase [Anaerolineae bacterium]
MMKKIRWGILSTGWIAKKFAQGLSVLPDAEIVAVGSRAQETADAFGDEFGVPHRHASYEALAEDSDADVIYIGTPHPFHKDNAILCLEAGKAVLLEKPFTINAAEAEEVITLAREKGLFLMEAMWARTIPIIVKLREMLAEGAIGEVRMLTADLGFRSEFDPKSRLFDPELGGGALLDVGIYPISFASMVLGTPSRIASLAHMGRTGVDEQAGIVFGYDGGRLAILHTALQTNTAIEATVMGTKGKIRVHSPWFYGAALTLSIEGRDDEAISLPYEGNGYNFEAAEVMRCLREGKLESTVMPLDETLALMQTLDAIRAQWGFKYPME